MDSPLQNPTFQEKDLDVLKFNPKRNYAIWRNWKDSSLQDLSLEKEREVKSFVDEITEKRSNPGMAVILGTRDSQGAYHNPAILEYFPFSREATQQLTKELHLHGDIVRVINRSDVAFFEVIDLSQTPHKSIHHCYRTSGTWEGDLALSSVYYPETGFTTTLILGCSKDVANIIATRLENSEDAWKHPLLIVVILAELERQRQLNLVDDSVFRLLERVRELGNTGAISTTSNLIGQNDSLELWITVSQLRTALKSWKEQLFKMEQHVDELEKQLRNRIDELKAEAIRCTDLCNGEVSRNSLDKYKKGTLRRNNITSDTPPPSPSEKKMVERSLTPQSTDQRIDWNTCAIGAGKRIQTRLKEIMTEIDEKVNECCMVIDGMVLSTQMSYNQIGYQDTQTNLRISQTNLQIASAARNDGKQMRSIAFLTMVFLPATFLASLFSMTFFNWTASEGEQVVAPQIWIYFVLAIGITVIVLVSWLAFTIAKRCSSVDTGWLRIWKRSPPSPSPV